MRRDYLDSGSKVNIQTLLNQPQFKCNMAINSLKRTTPKHKFSSLRIAFLAKLRSSISWSSTDFKFIVRLMAKRPSSL